MNILDLFANRTEDAGNLRKLIKRSSDVLELVGTNNLTLIDLALERADYIFLCYGAEGG